MFKSQWWVDLRFQQERRQVVSIALILLLAAAFVGIVGYSTYQRIQEEEKLNLSATAGAAVSAETPPPPQAQGVLETAAEMVLNGQLGDASAKLRDAGILVNRLNGIVAWKTGDTGTAALAFEQALRLNPDSAPDLVNLAGVMLVTGRAPEAVELLRKAQEKSPDDVYMANRYLLARFQAGDIAGVRNEVHTALELSPQNSIPRIAIPGAALELAAGKYANAANFLYAAKKALPLRVFDSLVEEPPIANYRDKPELVPFFPNGSPGAAPQPMVGATPSS